jgi:hypothetical protein
MISSKTQVQVKTFFWSGCSKRVVVEAIEVWGVPVFDWLKSRDLSSAAREATWTRRRDNCLLVIYRQKLIQQHRIIYDDNWKAFQLEIY